MKNIFFILFFLTSSVCLGEVSTMGIGEVSIEPDQAHLSVTVTAEDRQAKVAQKNLAEEVTRIKKQLMSYDVKYKNIKTRHYNLNVKNEYNRALKKSEFKGYRVTHQLYIKNITSSKIGSLMDAMANKKYSKNLKLNIGQLQWSHSKIKTYKNEALSASVKACKSKASIMASAAGLSLGSLTELSHSYMPVIPVARYARSMKMMESSEESAGTELSPGELNIKMISNCSYKAR